MAAVEILRSISEQRISGTATRTEVQVLLPQPEEQSVERQAVLLLSPGRGIVPLFCENHNTLFLSL